MLLAIDPGIVGTGYALFPLGSHVPLMTHVITSNKHLDWQDKLGEQYDRFTFWMDNCVQPGEITQVACETMTTFATSAKSNAATQRGDLMKVTLFAGVTYAWARQKHNALWIPVSVPEWKGNLPKQVVQQRIQATLGKDICRRLKIRSHAWDATGIGLYIKGAF